MHPREMRRRWGTWAAARHLRKLGVPVEEAVKLLAYDVTSEAFLSAEWAWQSQWDYATITRRDLRNFNVDELDEFIPDPWAKMDEMFGVWPPKPQPWTAKDEAMRQAICQVVMEPVLAVGNDPKDKSGAHA